MHQNNKRGRKKAYFMMICPKCGNQIVGLKCKCGVDLSQNFFLLVGNDAQKNANDLLHNTKKQQEIITKREEQRKANDRINRIRVEKAIAEKKRREIAAEERKYKEATAKQEEEKTGNNEITRRNNPVVGMNDPCPCGSGKKYKNCCALHTIPDSNTPQITLPSGALVEKATPDRTESNNQISERKSWISVIVLGCIIGLLLGGFLIYLDRSKGVKLFSANSKEITVGDTITFGQYEQDGNLENGKEPLTWTVVEESDGNALILADNCIDIIPYSSEQDGYELDEKSWTNSIIRDWLNNTFYQESFSDNEQQIIVSSELETNAYDSKSWWDNWREAEVGNVEKTNDKIFVLDAHEIIDIYTSLNMKTTVSPYALEKLSSLDDSKIAEQGEYDYFWLRNLIVGPYSNYSVCVFGGKPDDSSYGIASGIQFPDKYAYVRPAMRINTESFLDQMSESNVQQ